MRFIFLTALVYCLFPIIIAQINALQYLNPLMAARNKSSYPVLSMLGMNGNSNNNNQNNQNIPNNHNNNQNGIFYTNSLNNNNNNNYNNGGHNNNHNNPNNGDHSNNNNHPLPPLAMALGTNDVQVAIKRGNIVEILLTDVDNNGNTNPPSYIAVTGTKCTEIIVGVRAKLLSCLNPTCAITGEFKRLIGLSYELIQQFINDHYLPYTVVCHQDGRPQLLVTSQGMIRSFYFEDIAALLYTSLKQTAEFSLGRKAKDIVISLPSIFTTTQIQTMKTACATAGLNILEVVSDIAAASRAVVSSGRVHHGNVLILQLGDGFSEVAVFTVNNNNVEIKSQFGASFGGVEMISNVMNFLVAEIKTNYGQDISTNIFALKQLRTASELAIRILETKSEASIDIPLCFGDITFTYTLTRAKFDDLNTYFFEKVMKMVEQAITASQIDKQHIEYIVLTGGSLRTPKILDLLKHCSRNNKFIFYRTASIEGCAVIASGYSPTSRAAIGTDSLEELEVGTTFNGVTLQTFGVEVAGGRMNFMIEPNTPLPANITKRFTTTIDEQFEALIKIFEGSNQETADNDYLAAIRMKHLPAKPQGELELEVTFEVDEKNILTVSAKEKTSEKSVQKTILELETQRIDFESLNKHIYFDMAIIEFDA